jgi:uncharacterized membrane protein
VSSLPSPGFGDRLERRPHSSTLVRTIGSNASVIPWPLSRLGRLSLSVAAGVVASALTAALPRQTQIIVGIDAFLVTFVGLTYLTISVATPNQCMAMANQRTTIKHTEVIACIVATLVGIGAIGVMLQSEKGQAPWLRTLHLIGSLSALLFGWIAAQMTFAMQYMRMYYLGRDDERTDPGLAFPDRATPDLWDFVYYSFTIGMCYQTSDVSINSPTIRRLTLMHAVYSFFFVAAFVGFVVNVLSSLP